VKPFEDQGLPIIFERRPSVDKDELAREVAKKGSYPNSAISVRPVAATERNNGRSPR